MQKTWRPAVVVILSLIGAVLSAYLTAIHLRYLSTGQPSACNFNETLNCDVINTSPWSEVRGIPLSHLATLFYLATGLLSVVALRRDEWLRRLRPWLLLGALGAVGLSLVLAGVSAQLRALCVFCASLYAVNLALLVAMLAGGGAVADLGSLPGQLGGDLRALLRPPALALTLVALCGAGVSIYAVAGAVTAAHEQATARKKDVRIDLYDPTAPAIGPAGAAVTLVEISDFECPFCQRASETIAELRRLYPEQLRVVFRNFPLDQACNPLLKRQIHENACAAARAAICAGAQGPEKFWQYAEKLFSGATEPTDLPEHAKALGLDEASFAACQKEPATAARIATDIEACSKAGVVAVPVFLINGRRLAGAQPIEAFKALIDEELRARR